MPRKKKPVEAVVAVPVETLAVEPIASEPLVVEPLAGEPASPPPPPIIAEPAAQPAGDQKTWAPRGPVWFQTIPLSTSDEGPRMRLGRDNRFSQMAISFDVKPTEAVRERLDNDGWRWRQAENQWTRQLDLDHRARGQQDAEKLFEALAKIERQDRGLNEVEEAIRR